MHTEKDRNEKQEKIREHVKKLLAEIARLDMEDIKEDASIRDELQYLLWRS